MSEQPHPNGNEEYPDPYRSLRQKAKQLLDRWQTLPKPLSEESQLEMLEDLKLSYLELDLQNDELRSSQQALSASRDRYYLYHDLAPISYFTFSRRGLIVEANLKAAELLGMSRMALKRNRIPFNAHLHESAHADFFTHLENVLHTDEPQSVNLLLAKPRDTPLLVTSRRLRHPSGEWVCASSVVDTSVEFHLQEDLDAIRKERALLFDPDSDQILAWLDENLRLHQIEGSLVLSRFVGGEPVDIGTLFHDEFVSALRDAMATVKRKGEAEPVRLRSEPAPDFAAKVFAVPGKLQGEPRYLLVMLKASAVVR